jgi:hypothetical protein
MASPRGQAEYCIRWRRQRLELASTTALILCTSRMAVTFTKAVVLKQNSTLVDPTMIMTRMKTLEAKVFCKSVTPSL